MRALILCIFLALLPGCGGVQITEDPSFDDGGVRYQYDNEEHEVIADAAGSMGVNGIELKARLYSRQTWSEGVLDMRQQFTATVGEYLSLAFSFAFNLGSGEGEFCITAIVLPTKVPFAWCWPVGVSEFEDKSVGEKIKRT